MWYNTNMKITALIENTPGVEGCIALHGLSFYIETKKHKILFDFGPSEATLSNAEKLGIDLRSVDTAILSHGHYDHSGGLLAFASLNPHAKIYMQTGATGENYAFDGPEKGYRYIGIDKRILELPQLQLLNGDFQIDEELSLFTINHRVFPLPATSRRMVRKIPATTAAPASTLTQAASTPPASTPLASTPPASTDPAAIHTAPVQATNTPPSASDHFIQDDFTHEHCLFINESSASRALISGCAHNGILNILEELIRKFGQPLLPQLVLSGFHLMKRSGYENSDYAEQREIAQKLTSYPCKYYTCHCTGLEPYEQMKPILSDQLEYFHTGQLLELASK